MASIGNHSLHMFLQWNIKAILRCRLYNSGSTGHIWLLCRGLQALVHKPPFLQGWLSGQLAECPGCIVLFLCGWNSCFIALLWNVFSPQCLWLFSARPWDSLSVHMRLWVFQLHRLKTSLPPKEPSFLKHSSDLCLGWKCPVMLIFTFWITVHETHSVSLGEGE